VFPILWKPLGYNSCYIGSLKKYTYQKAISVPQICSVSIILKNPELT